jgi:asparagine synthetase A
LSVLEVVQGHAAPVDRESLLQFGVAHRRHLEWEKVALRVVSDELLALAQVALQRIDLERVVVAQELSVEASDDKDLVLSELAHAGALPGCDDRLVDLVK